MNILIIDDTQADHHLYVEYLSAEGEHYHFLHAYNGEQGLAMYRQHPVDCVLLDYHLPDVDGLEVLKRLCAAETIVPVIMMTGEGSESVAVTAMKLGSQDYIPKGVVTCSALKRAIEHTAKHAVLLKKTEQYRADLERSNHDLELFANVVAHDLKSPLRAVALHLSIVRDKCARLLDEKAMRSLEFAMDGAKRMHALIEALFTYARLGFSEPDFREVDLRTVLKNTEQDLSVAIEEAGARITCDTLPAVRGDPHLLSELLQNLIGNALKYRREAPRIHISATPEAEGWHICVRDNGIGIPCQHLEKIFTIFRRLHSEDEYPGIGLGLAICDRIVKRHGGRLWVESEPGKGSVFHFTLPEPVAQIQKRAAYG